MEDIFNEISSPNLIASALIAIIIALLSPVIEKFRKLIINSGISFFRWLRLRDLKRIKKQRQNGDEVTYQTIKAHAYGVLFFSSLAAIWWFLIFGFIKGINHLPAWTQIVMTLPVYIFEILWLVQIADAKELVRYRGKLKITGSAFRSK